MNRLHLYIIVSTLFILTSCRPPGILHSWEMRAVLVDLHKADATMQYAGLVRGNEEIRTIYYAQVLERHGVTQAEFDSSLVWYTSHPQIFDKIYPRVISELQAQQDTFLALHEEELAFIPSSQIEEVSTQPSEFRRRDLDSILWVTQHGYPHMWHEMPSMENLIDQLFPQVGVLGGGVVDTLQTGVSVPEVPDDKESLPRRKTPSGRFKIANEVGINS